MKRYLNKILVLISALMLSLSLNAQVFSVDNSFHKLPDGNIEITFTVNVEPGWYVYSTTPIKNGPMPTSFTVDEENGFKIVEALQNVAAPQVKIDKGFGVEVEYYEDKAVFKEIIKPDGEQSFTVAGTLMYQVCNGMECTLNDEEVKINIDPAKLSVKEETETAAPAIAASEPVETETKDNSKDSSIWSFLLIAFLAGLGSVLTPCVFPMIPMTVGFLIGGGSSKKAGILKGVIYGLSIMVLYTALGLIVSLLESTAATDALGTHWIPNLIFAVLFLVFAVSFLGAFEITLPNGLANKADKRADKGGYIAAFFMAVAMVIVSFSCTGPFVGSILAAAVMGGLALKPILGMAVFGFAFALPFVVLSFFPGFLKKLPKSGGWLNVVKVVFAFIMLAFAMKFLYNVDAYFGWGIITRLGYLSIWAALSLLLGLYFLDVFHTKHDSPTEGIGWGRTIAAIATFAFTFYLIAGIFGAPLKSISGLIPPQDGSTLTIGISNTSSDAPVAGETYSTLDHFSNLEDALAESEATGKPIFLSFKSHTCSVCKMMESNVLNDGEVLDILKNEFIIANLYVDDKTEDAEYKTLGKRLREYEMKKFQSASQPLYAIIDADENIISGPTGKCEKEEFLEFLRK